MRVQFGSGGNLLEGWINTDANYDDPKLRVDITKLPLPFDDNSVEMALAEHVAEHTSISQCYCFFKDVHRILKPGAFFRVICPTISTDMPKDLVIDLITGHGHQIALTPDLMWTLLWAAGFSFIWKDSRQEIDGHWRAIGTDRDNMESCRMMAKKA